MQLSLLFRRDAGSDDAELASRQVQAGSRQNLSVALEDHPFVQLGMQSANIHAQPLVHLAVHQSARRLAAAPPVLRSSFVDARRCRLTR